MATTNKRRMAAIMFCDIQGYTALMQNNEQLALEGLQKFKQELEVEVSKHQGQIIQFYGDGCLSVFDSSTDAVICATNLQQVFQRTPAIPVRIGLHAGDILFKEGNIYGDAVNITSRIESMGVPGSILLSSNIRNQIKNKPEFQVRSIGKYEFKNVDEAMTVYALNQEGLTVPNREDLQGKFKKQKRSIPLSWIAIVSVILISGIAYILLSNDRPQPAPISSNAIAIFPFDVKGSPEIQYLGDGMVDLISTHLDDIPGINSIDPNLIFSQFDDNSGVIRNPELVAKRLHDLNANQFILGNILELDGQLKITASRYDKAGQLIDKKTVEGPKNGQLAKTIDELIKQLIAEEMKRQGQEFTSLGAITSDNMESLKSYLRGEQAYRSGNYMAAYNLFKEATQLDSTFAMAWMRLADAGGWDIDTNTPEAYQNRKKYKHKLPKKWQEYYEVVMLHEDANRKTVPAYKKLIRKYGESRAFVNGIAEFYWHFNPVYGRSQLEAKPYLLKNLELEPNNVESFIHLSECAVMEADTAALQNMLANIAPDAEIFPEIQIKILMLQDTVTDEEIAVLVNHPYFRNEFLFRLFAPIKKQPTNYELIYRVLKQYPNELFSQLTQLFEQANSGKEMETFNFSRQLVNRNEDFYIPLDKYYNCIPATLMADKTFLPLSEFYDELYQNVKDKDSPWEIYAAIKYAIALDKTSAIKALKTKLSEKIKDPDFADDAKYYQFSLNAFEARMDGDNDAALVWIDSAFIYPNGFWEILSSCMDKTIMQANIYAEQGDFEKAIPYFENISLHAGMEFLTGYATYQLSQWYEQIGERENALEKCNILLKTYKNCDPKYRPWVEETKKRKERLVSEIQ